jgi:hypothetical protein
MLNQDKASSQDYPRMPFERPTEHYDERISPIDEKLCELIKQRKEMSNNNPGFPPFEYIAAWAKKFEIYEDLIKTVFASLWNEKQFRPITEPDEFRKHLLVLKSVEKDNRMGQKVNAIRIHLSQGCGRYSQSRDHAL